MSEFIKKYLIKASEIHLDFCFTGEKWDENVLGSDDVDNFIRTKDSLTLYAIKEDFDEKKVLKFFNQAEDYINCENRSKIVVFCKNQPGILSDDDIVTNVHITSLCESPTLALYRTLNNVFTPLLAQQLNNSTIQRHIANLQADLRSTILSCGNDESSLATSRAIIIESLENEVEYWDGIAQSSKNARLNRSTASSFRDLIQPIALEFNVIETLPPNEVEDLLESCHSLLDDLWRHEPSFPKDRIIHLMDVIGDDVIKNISSQFRNSDIWGENSSRITEMLIESISVGDRWLTSCKQLTELFWPSYSENMWKGPSYQPPNLIKFINRLKDILNIRTFHRQLTRLLTLPEQEELQTKEMFGPFRDLNLMEFGQYSSNLWLKSHKQFEYLLQPAEEKVGAKLKKQLSSITANTRQLLHEFSRYAELINRPIVKQTLLNERQFLLTSLYDYVKQLQNEISVENSNDGIVHDVVMMRQVEAKVEQVHKTSRKLLDDLQGFDKLDQIVTESLSDLKQQHSELFDSWTREISVFIKHDTLSLKESDSVVQFSKNKFMKVNYAPRLVSLIGEVRQFKALGYKIPSEIEEITKQAKKFMGLAKTLEQIANFHNTIGDRMIICQRPMMLASAVELSRLVQEEKVVSWGDTKSVEKYVGTLKNAVEKLSRENNVLASYYHQIMDKIKQLNDVDLIKDFAKWKENTRQMRELMSQVEVEKGFKNMQAWKNDVDHNLLQVLEKQYIRSLDTLHLYLPEIYTDIVYRQLELHFSPDEEVLKEKYQQQLKRFLDIPRNFHGVSSESAGEFAAIVTRNQNHLSKVTKHTDDLFEHLRSVLKHWRSWLQLDPLDVGKLTSWQHWDLHFRASKTFGQEIAKLPSNEERVGCFLIGLSRLRSDFESHNRSYWDELVSSLKDSIAQDVVKLQNFIDPSTAILTRQPVTLEEVGECGASHANIMRQWSEMDATFDGMVQKSHMLASWTREQVDAVNRLKGARERLESLLENHHHIIAKQMETIRTTLNIESENIEKEMERFAAKWEQIKPNKTIITDLSIDELHGQLEAINEKKSQWREITERKDKLLSDFERFNISEIPQFRALAEIENLMQETNSWSLFEEFYKDLGAIEMEEWVVFRKKVYKFEDFLTSWENRIGTRENVGGELAVRILQEIQTFQRVLPALRYVRGEDFSDKHWMDVYNVLGMPPKPLDSLLLKDFLQASDNLSNSVEELQAICKKAASEIVVRQALSELEQWDIQCRFILTDHTDSHKKTIKLIKDYKEILNKIGDNQSLLQSVKNSSDYESFSERATLWEGKLANLDESLTVLTQIQRKWMYLEPIFGSGTLLMAEKSRFDKIDKDFRHLLHYIDRDARVSSLTRYPNLTATLKNLQDQLGRCQKSLENFLSDKRNKFPRFLFLADDDLLEVVGQSSRQQVIQNHLKKLFAGIDSIHFGPNGQTITAIASLHGEIVTLSNAVNITETAVEEWLNMLVKQMQITLKDLLVKCVGDGQNADPLKYPSQILCLSDNINFTLKTEQAIGNMTLPPLLAHYKAQLGYFSSLELNSASIRPPGDDESNVLELKLKALLLDTIHHISVLEELLDSNVVKVTDWTWQKQLRFHSNSLGEVTVKMANARMDYAYEYLGNSPKLVRTPLTDRCFLTLSQGMHLGMGGNPYGPAGTGKTESIKALGGLLGRQVLVFNCDEGIDSNSMGRILSGLVRSGAWGCFDEFNRLDEATLSAVSMQIQPIQVALRTHAQKLTLLDQEIDVNKHCGIFVTLNPAGGSYGGRNKLPDNLKQLFRPVVMTHPDQEQIATTLLHCDGYQNANLIGKKIIEVFDCSSKLLSKQHHYDWGLRAIKSVLNGCGGSLKRYRKNNGNSEEISLDLEFNLVVQILKTDTLSKLTFTDSVKFDGIVRDVFKHINVQDFSNEILVKALEDSYNDLDLIPDKRQISKCLELHEQLKQRMGVAVVGPPSSGKTTIRNLLFSGLSKIGKSLKQHSLNPKSMQKTDLLGQIDLDTRQWNDGVLTLYSLEVTSEPQEMWSWIVCDGNIDPEWVESLNSVLDDNRLLTLPSGWRIQFGLNVNFIFETHTLKYASPATISRMGVVFLSEEDLNLNNYVNNFVKKQGEQYESLFGSVINDYLLKSIDWIMNEGEIVMNTSKLAIIDNGLSQIDGVMSKSQFSVALINGLGQLLRFEYREVFAQQIYDWMEEVPPPDLLKSRYNRDRDIIDSYHTNPDVTFVLDDDKMSLILTGDVLRTLDCLRLWLVPRNEHHFLLVGPHGCAKSLILATLVREREDVEMVTIFCSANLLPKYVIDKIAHNCIAVNTNKGKVYKPKKGHLIVYLKNLHLLKPDQWGTNIVVEFLHQLITYNAFFDVNLELVRLENVTIVGTLSQTNSLSTRFTSIVHIYNVNCPDREDLLVIVVSHLTAILQKCLKKDTFGANKPKIVKLAATLISCYDKIRDVFLETDYKHYVFSPHDIISWCSNILRHQLITDEISAEHQIFEILFYEGTKLFGDRLVDEKDVSQLFKILTEAFVNLSNNSILAKDIHGNYYVPTSPTSSGGNSDFGKLQKLNKNDWENTVKRAMVIYEREGQDLDILVNDELMNLAASISNCDKSVVLVGRSGIGRKSAVKIVSALQSARLISPLSDHQPQFNNDLKSAMQMCGVEGEHVYLLLQDELLSKTHIVSMVNILISAGEVPGLYSSVELDSVISGLRDEASRKNFEGDLRDFFAESVKNRLHVVACIDVDNENLWNIFESCPAFLQSSKIIWKSQWNNETIETMPISLIDKINSEDRNKVEHCTSFPKLFDVIKNKNAAPSRFISMVKLYVNFYEEKKSTIVTKQQKLTAGVSKLNEASNLVTQLKRKAAEQGEKLAEKQEKANAALDMISKTMRNANLHKEEMEILKGKTEGENRQLMVRKEEIEKELAEVEPLIQEARSAVGNIKTEALSEIRSLRAPPDIIRDILEGVLRLMGIQDTSWNSMKTFLAKRGVKEDIRCFDASKITTDNRHAVEKLMTIKKDSFDSKAAKRASVAAAPLAAWVHANVKYSQVSDKIRPLEREQDKLQKNLSSAEMQLGELSAGLLDVDATVAQLKTQLSAFTKEAAEIEIDLNKAQDTLKSAEGLVGKLTDEFERWQLQLEDLSIQLGTLPDFCSLAAAFVTYLSAETEENRQIILRKWMKVVGVDHFNLEEFLTTEREQLQWQSEGLPHDKVSIQNTIMILKGEIVPLLIDPTSSAINWFKKHFKHKQIESITQNSPKFINNLQLAVRFGKILIVEEIDDISPLLLPILRQEFSHQGQRKLINFNGKFVDYHQDFNLILCSRNEKLEVKADVAAIISAMNFTVTHSGLTEQLLSCAIRQENPELDDRRKYLLKEREELQEKQYQLQNRLLEDLANSSGDILENSNLLASLNETKASSTAISRALVESEEIQKKLQFEYEVYKKISSFQSSLYFACNEMSKFNVLYVLSVPACIRLFLEVLQTFPTIKANEQDQKNHLFSTVYNFVSRGVFKNDRPMFAIHLIRRLFSIPQKYWNVFVNSSTIRSRNDTENIPDWIPERSRYPLLYLQATLPELYGKLQLEERNLWKTFMISDHCEKEFPLSDGADIMSDFEKTLIVQALRPDRAFSSIVQTILKMTGLRSIDPGIPDLKQIYKESTNHEAILLLTVSGTDPSSEIRDLAGNLEYVEVAMGQGQESKAISALYQTSTSGQWLILKNLHLVTDWLTILAQNLQNIRPHENFRLWLITEPNQRFNFVLAQNSLKFVYEAPQGLRNNLIRTFNSWGCQYFDKLMPPLGRIYFVLSCIHAILQERRTFIPQGWSKSYDFSDSDLSSCVKLVEDLSPGNSHQIQWKFISGLCSDAVYGGRIENVNDMSILRTYLKQYLLDDVLSHRWRPLRSKTPLPNSSKYEDYLNFLRQLPERDSPSSFGLPENIGRAWERQISADIVRKLRGFSLCKDMALKFQKELWHKELAPLMNGWKKLNHGQDFVKITLPSVLQSPPSSISETFISEEYHLAISLIQKIHRSFMTLNKICKGSILPDEDDLRLGISLINQMVPKLWQSFWEGPNEPYDYLRNVIAKATNLSKWISESRNVYDTPVDLSIFLNPGAFLTSYKQEYSRQSNTPMDQLVLESIWKASAFNKKHITLTNLLIEGGLFDGINLKCCTSQNESINQAPDCHLTWKEKKSSLDCNRIIRIPVYYTSNRQKQLMTLQIQCDSSDVNEKDKWIQAGLAFFLDY